MLAFLYGLSLVEATPVYRETVAVTAALLALYGAGLVRLVPAASSAILGEEPHLKREGERTFRRCGTRELFKLFLIVLLVRLLEFPLTYIVHYAMFGYTGTFFEIQRLWLDFYHPETAFPLYGYLSDVFWIFTVNFNHARFIGSYFFTSLAVVALYYLVQLDFDRKVARRAVRYFLLLPFSLTLMGTVPDGLFLLVAILTLLFIRKKWFPAASGFAMLAVLTHALGVLLFVPLLFGYLSFLIGNVRANRGTEKGYIFKQILTVLSLLLVPLGAGLVMLYGNLRFGDALSLHRSAFGTDGAGLSGLFRFTDAAFLETRTVGGNALAVLFGAYVSQFAYLLFALVMLLLAADTVPSSFALLMAVTIPITSVTGRMQDTAGFITITAPFVITFAAKIKNRWIDALVTVLLFGAWIAYFFAFIAGFTG